MIKNEITTRMKSRLRTIERNATVQRTLVRGEGKRARQKFKIRRKTDESMYQKNFATFATFVERNKIFTPATRWNSRWNSAVHAMREKGGLYHTLNVSRNVHEPRDRVKIQQKHTRAAIFVASGFLFRPLFSLRLRTSSGITHGQQLFFPPSMISRWNRDYRCVVHRNFPLHENLLVQVSIVGTDRAVSRRVRY